MTDPTFRLCELLSQLDNEREAHNATRGKLEALQAIHHKLWVQKEALEFDIAFLKARAEARKEERRQFYEATRAEAEFLHDRYERISERLNRARRELLIQRLLVRINTTHSGNSRNPLMRIRIARARLERVRGMP
jgi:hypothetical protein